MSRYLAPAVNGLVERGELSAFRDTGEEVVIRRKQKVVGIQIIDKRKVGKDAVVLSRSWDYPIDIEQAVCWDILDTLRNFILGQPAEQQELWNDIFGSRYPELMIDIKIPLSAREIRIAQGNFRTRPVAEEKLAPPNAKPPIKIKHLNDYRGNYLSDRSQKALKDFEDVPTKPEEGTK